MVKRVLAIATVGGLAMTAVLLTTATRAHAQAALPTSDRAAGLIIYPKLVADASDTFGTGRATDTLVQLTNTSTTNSVLVHCNIVDATSHCVSFGTQCTLTNHIANTFSANGACRTNADCDLGGVCEPCWNEQDFSTLTLSPNQAVGWVVSSGSTSIPTIDPTSLLPTGLTAVPPAPESFFIGELKCFEATTVAGDIVPINANDLKGEATIEEVSGGLMSTVDARAYNAIGIQAVSANGLGQSTPGVLCLGATPGSNECATAEFASCPSVLILNHFFDDAPLPTGSTTTDLTLIPCTEDFVNQDANMLNQTTVQFLVFNEFEQRFSTSIPFSCFLETPLSNIDQRADLGQEKFSIFNFGVAGTLAGQTRIRGVRGANLEVGNGILGVAEEFRTGLNGTRGSSAFNLNYVGIPTKGDFIRIP